AAGWSVREDLVASGGAGIGGWERQPGARGGLAGARRGRGRRRFQRQPGLCLLLRRFLVQQRPEQFGERDRRQVRVGTQHRRGGRRGGLGGRRLDRVRRGGLRSWTGGCRGRLGCGGGARGRTGGVRLGGRRRGRFGGRAG